jgi:methionyl-tRNA synthetase
MTQYYITTSIPYVNGRPHIGHALEYVQTDTFARYRRQIGRDVRCQTGSDENSLKNVLAAEREGLSTRELVDRNVTYFTSLLERLDFSADDFIRTAVEERHAAGVARLWEACDRNGAIYKKSYRGLYCVGCEQFYAEDELTAEGLCPEHLVPPDVVEEENYFFRLSEYGDALLELIEGGQLRIIPESRRNEVTSFIRRGLQDFSISRSQARARGWGVPVPGDPSQVMYVWFDALGNYITALGYATDDEAYQRYWVNADDRVHAIGKGILRFHAVYWPAMLLAGGVKPPTTVFVHGYLTLGGGKIGKSLGNAVDPVALVDQFGTDAVRYHLLRAVPATGDADFTVERLATQYNTDLANDLGNLLNRTVSMIHRYRGGDVPAAGASDSELRDLAAGLPDRIGAAMSDYDPQAALGEVWALVRAANKHVETSAPWNLAKEERGGSADASARLDGVLYDLAESLRLLAVHLEPFLPETSGRIAAQLAVPPENGDYAERVRWGGLRPGTRVASPAPLFPRIEVAAAE